MDKNTVTLDVRDYDRLKEAERQFNEEIHKKEWLHISNAGDCCGGKTYIVTDVETINKDLRAENKLLNDLQAKDMVERRRQRNEIDRLKEEIASKDRIISRYERSWIVRMFA